MNTIRAGFVFFILAFFISSCNFGTSPEAVKGYLELPPAYVTENKNYLPEENGNSIGEKFTVKVYLKK